MVRLVIADDEEVIREGMRDCVDWDQNGVELVGIASDGESAYRLILETDPDIVLIDIHMPEMTGLQVIEKIRNEHKMNTSFVILSGYNEFEYARNAISLRVDDYLIKPCSSADLLQAVYKAIQRIDIVKSLSDRTGANNFFSHYYKYMRDCAGHPMDLKYPRQEERQLIAEMQVGTEAGVREKLRVFWDAVLCGNESFDAVLNCCVLLYIEFNRVLVERGLGSRIEDAAKMDWAAELNKNTLYQFMLDTLLAIYTMVNSGKEINVVISKAIKYINDHYAEELCLETVALAVGLSPTYLSASFKQNIGKNFIDYVHHIRISKAEQLLAESDFNIATIAEKVGYQNPKYFLQVFKKITGITPGQYKKQQSI